MEFINEGLIGSLIEDTALQNSAFQNEVIEKSLEAKGLTLRESAALLNIESGELLEKLFDAASKVKEKIYGNRLVLFAPLYVMNRHVNNCLYCTFRKDNKELIRKALSIEEIKEEAEFLIRHVHKKILLVAGERSQKSFLDYVGEAIDSIYKIKIESSNIRRINVNAVPLSVEGFKRLEGFGIGTYQCFQETYHFETYVKMHPEGPKVDAEQRMFTINQFLCN